jgi:hypothetical protein
VVVIEREESRGWFLEGGGNIFQDEKGMKSLIGRCVRQNSYTLSVDEKKETNIAGQIPHLHSLGATCATVFSVSLFSCDIQYILFTSRGVIFCPIPFHPLFSCHTHLYFKNDIYILILTYFQPFLTFRLCLL